MAKVYPQEPALAACNNSNASKRETYTVWMKSLVFHSKGCTVYNSNGEIVYRVDNYDRKAGGQVSLMDVQGTVLCTIHKVLLAPNQRTYNLNKLWFHTRWPIELCFFLHDFAEIIRFWTLGWLQKQQFLLCSKPRDAVVPSQKMLQNG